MTTTTKPKEYIIRGVPHRLVDLKKELTVRRAGSAITLIANLFGGSLADVAAMFSSAKKEFDAGELAGLLTNLLAKLQAAADNDRLGELLSIFIVPADEKERTDEERRDLILDAPMEVIAEALGSFFHFRTSARASSTSTSTRKTK